LPQARAGLGTAAERHRLAAASIVRARAELEAARAAEAAVGRIIEVRQAEERAAIQKQAHAEINERILDRHRETDTLIPPLSTART
jgi:hypothetical protein